MNVSPEYYSPEDYIKGHTRQEILDTVGLVDDKTSYMGNALGLLEYLYNNAENLYHGDLLVGDKCTYTAEEIGVPEDVYYQLPLLVNGEYIGFDAVYDVEYQVNNSHLE